MVALKTRHIFLKGELVEAILKFLADNIVIVCIAAAAIIALVIVLISISAKNARIKRDAEYAKMLEEVPIENDDREDVSIEEGKRPEFEKTEMDWLKGEKGYYGVLRTELPPLKTCKKDVKNETARKIKTEGKQEINPDEYSTQRNDKAKESDKTQKNNRTDRKNPADDKSETNKKTKAAENKIRQLRIDDIADENAATDVTEEEIKMAEKKAGAKPDAKVAKASAKPDAKAKKTGAKPEEKAPAAKKAVGKWVIKEKGEGEFVAYLYANNKEVMLTSETYSTPDGAKKGIGTIQKNAAVSENFTYYRDKKSNYYFKLKTSQNRFLCVGETYPNRSACLKSIESVKKFVDSPVSEGVEKDITIIKYVPAPDKNTQTKKYSGKWTIMSVDDMFMAQLFASNGELLLSSESYSSYASAKEAIDNIAKNAEAGNFIIDSDKKGRYFFKLRNDHKLTLCIGETYSQLSACQSAIESVRSFLRTAKLAEN